MVFKKRKDTQTTVVSQEIGSEDSEKKIRIDPAFSKDFATFKERMGTLCDEIRKSSQMNRLINE